MIKETKNREVIKFLIGPQKAKLIEYGLKKKRFYQAQVAFDLGWHINTVQYHLNNFTKYGLLVREPTVYKTYYHLNLPALKNIFTLS